MKKNTVSQELKRLVSNLRYEIAIDWADLAALADKVALAEAHLTAAINGNDPIPADVREDVSKAFNALVPEGASV